MRSSQTLFNKSSQRRTKQSVPFGVYTYRMHSKVQQKRPLASPPRVSTHHRKNTKKYSLTYIAVHLCGDRLRGSCVGSFLQQKKGITAEAGTLALGLYQVPGHATAVVQLGLLPRTRRAVSHLKMRTRLRAAAPRRILDTLREVIVAYGGKRLQVT